MAFQRKPTLLITSAGSLVAAAILRCLEPVRGALTVVGTNSLAAPVAFLCDSLYRVPPTSDTVGFATALDAIMARERPDLVLAGRDEDIGALAMLSAACPTVLVPAPPLALAPVFTDKLQTWRFAQSLGLPFAATAEGPDGAAGLAERHGYPLLAKPRCGAGSRGVHLLADRSGLDRAAADPRLMVQTFLAPEDLDGQWERYRQVTAAGMPWSWDFTDIETTAELLVEPDDGGIRAWCLDFGTTAPPLRTDVTLIDDGRVAAVGRAWAGALAARGHRGPVNIQGKRLPDGSFIPYEIGARFGGTSISRAMLGCNLVLGLVATALGLPQSPAPRRQGPVGLAEWRLTLPGGWYDEFESSGRWLAPTGWPPGDPFSTLKEDVDGDEGVFAPGPDPDTGLDELHAFGIWRDRAALAAWACGNGLPFVGTAATIAEADELIRMTGFPLIAKPRRKPHRDDGPVRLLECRTAVAAVMEAADLVIQPCLDPSALDGDRAAWRDRPGAPWHWRVADIVEVGEAVIDRTGAIRAVRVGRCTQKGGDPFEMRAIAATDIADTVGLWAAGLAQAGYRGGLRLTGKRDGQGQWLPFSASRRLIGLPEPDRVESRIKIPF